MASLGENSFESSRSLRLKFNGQNGTGDQVTLGTLPPRFLAVLDEDLEIQPRRACNVGGNYFRRIGTLPADRA
jgi:hypothetical protein